MSLQLACRFCGTEIKSPFCDLGMSPLSNAYVPVERLHDMEPFYPLQVYVCGNCHLVQLPEFETPEQIFNDYAYFSSYSDTWLAHARAYVEAMRERLALGAASQVVEIASNDGYLLQFFKEKGIPVMGIEPAENVARVAIEKNIPTRIAFFGTVLASELAAEGVRADLLLGNNVLAHVPDLNDFVAGLKIALKPDGVITIEFPHLLRLMAENQFDTIYHEHFSYFSFTTVERVFAVNGLTLFDVEELPTHGGSLRIFGCHAENAARLVAPAVAAMKKTEAAAGVKNLSTYSAFAARVTETKRRLLTFLIEAKQRGAHIVGYGAPAKGNTLLNYCGIREDFLDYTVDRSPHKQGKFLPGTRIPIRPPESVAETRPDFLLILPWNLKDEIIHQMAHIRRWGGRFVVPIPQVSVIA